ncbi:MAG: sigma-70 family RNA polymerase sigma factor [Planctomycetes bacterium]|nr:sigma-70 family RNA polymerase sigma factor [Planctomycetota bacterium]
MTPIATDEPLPGAADRVEQLLASRGARLRALAGRLLGQDADDGLQEVYAAACRSLPSFRGEARLSTWFHRLAIRVLCAYRRRRDRRAGRELPDGDVEQRLSDRALRQRTSPLAELDQRERRARVLGAIAGMSPPLREVLLLRGENLTYDEIASTLELPLGTVKSRMAAATIGLAERLARTAEDAP